MHLLTRRTQQVKTRMMLGQMPSQSPLKAIIKIARDEGVRSLWSGFVPRLIWSATFFAVGLPCSLTPCRGLAAPSVATFMTWDWFAGGHFNLRDRARPNPEHRRGWLLCNTEEGWTWRRGDGEREEPDSGVGRHDSKLLCLLHWCSRHGHPLTSDPLQLALMAWHRPGRTQAAEICVDYNNTPTCSS